MSNKFIHSPPNIFYGLSPCQNSEKEVKRGGYLHEIPLYEPDNRQTIYKPYIVIIIVRVRQPFGCVDMVSSVTLAGLRELERLSRGVREGGFPNSFQNPLPSLPRVPERLTYTVIWLAAKLL